MKTYDLYIAINQAHPIITSFIKFALLATLGESLGLKIKEGRFSKEGFGLLPRAIVWGFLGISIFFAFRIFAAGTPTLLSVLGFASAPDAIKGAFSLDKLATSFSISVAMNVVFAPVMMTFHKITDTHIVENGGRSVALLKPIDFSGILQKIDWNIQWGFVFKKTIPLFWIPAHTITFLLPPEFQVLFAAILSVILGAILSVASVMK